METVMTMESFAALINDSRVKLTKPQQEIADMILAGHKLVTVNQHHQSGGQMMWMRKGQDYPSYAGHIYKAYVHMQYNIRKSTGIDPDMRFAWDLRKDLIYR